MKPRTIIVVQERYTTLKLDGPREKLRLQGVDSLSNSDLVAIIFGVGSRKESVIDMAHRVVKDYGLDVLENARDYLKLSRQLVIPEFKALQLLSALELGRRIYTSADKQRIILNSPQKVFNHFNFLAVKTREEVHVAYLNSRQLLLKTDLIAIGSIDSVQVSSRDIIAPALDCNALGIILVHNHPSNEVSPSLADREFTSSLKEACKLMGIQLLDHLIICKQEYFSFLTTGAL